MHQASPPLADLSAAGPHSPSPQHAREAGSGGEGSFQRSTSDGSDMSDADREEAIRQAGLSMQHAYWHYEQAGDFGSLGEAHRQRLLMTELIRGRSAQQVARMDSLRGLA